MRTVLAVSLTIGLAIVGCGKQAKTPKNDNGAQTEKTAADASTNNTSPSTPTVNNQPEIKPQVPTETTKPTDTTTTTPTTTDPGTSDPGTSPIDCNDMNALMQLLASGGDISQCLGGLGGGGGTPSIEDLLNQLGGGTGP